jgi:hypothetical protein
MARLSPTPAPSIDALAPTCRFPPIQGIRPPGIAPSASPSRRRRAFTRPHRLMRVEDLDAWHNANLCGDGPPPGSSGQRPGVHPGRAVPPRIGQQGVSAPRRGAAVGRWATNTARHCDLSLAPSCRTGGDQRQYWRAGEDVNASSGVVPKTSSGTTAPRWVGLGKLLTGTMSLPRTSRAQKTAVSRSGNCAASRRSSLRYHTAAHVPRSRPPAHVLLRPGAP